MDKTIRGLIPEWVPQDAVLLAWPDETMDWADTLSEIRACYILLVRALLDYVPVILLAQDTESVPLQGDYPHRLTVLEMPMDDTWVRDYGPLSLQTRTGVPVVVDFAFNAWGGKFESTRDNQVSQKLPIFREGMERIDRHGLVLEGGAVESDGSGRILTTAFVLRDPKRNPTIDEAALTDALRAEELIPLQVKPLLGDDTDGHIDTLARFCDEATIVYAACDDPSHPDYETLQQLEEQLRESLGSYRLVPLPTPAVKRDRDGSVMPASYANFLITNGAVFVPTYRDPMDAEALRILGELFDDRRIIPVDAIPLIRQHGSIHCATMQIPQGFIREEYL